MGKHSFLDSILKRPSQNYAPEQATSNAGKGKNAGQSSSLGPNFKYAGPSDLPNAPNSGPQASLLNNSSFFRRNRKTSSMFGSVAGGSAAGSEVGGPSASMASFSRSRFRRKTQPPAPIPIHHYPPELRPGYEGPNMPPPATAPISPSVADSSMSKSKKRWWRRSRAPSVAGESVFSDPEVPAPTHTPWSPQGQLIGTPQRSPRRAAQSELASPTNGHSRRYSTMSAAAPPVPRIPPQHQRKASSGSVGAPGAPSGRLHSNIAPLGNTSLNPTLTAKPPKAHASSSARRGQSLTGSSSELSGAMSYPVPPASPTLSQASGYSRQPQFQGLPSSRPTSPRMHISSLPPGSDAGIHRPPSQQSLRSQGSGQRGSSDWKTFVQSMSGTNISKVWEGGRVGSPDLESAVRARSLSGGAVAYKNDRRRMQMARLQKEIETEAQYDQVQRDPGVVHQDLLARAASVVVGQAPSPSLRPGSILPGTATNAGPSAVSRPVATRPVAQAPARDLTDGAEDRSGRSEDRGRKSEESWRRSSEMQRESRRSEEHMASDGLYVDSQGRRSDEVHRRQSFEASDEASEEGTEESSGDEHGLPGRQQTMLEAVREEDEESQSTHRSSRRTSRAISNIDAESAMQRPPSALNSISEPAKAQAEPEGDQETPVAASAPLPSDRESAQSGLTASTSSVSRDKPLPAITIETARDEASASAPASESSSTEKHEGPATSSEDEDDRSESHVKSKYAQAASMSTSSSQSGSTGSLSETRTAEEGSSEEEGAHKARISTEPTSSTLHSQLSSQPTRSTLAESIDDEVDENEAARNAQASRATVTFSNGERLEDPSKDSTPTIGAKSMQRSHSMSSSMRPETLPRRLSNVSLGTSFGVSKVLRGGSRASSRKGERSAGSDDGLDTDESDGDADEGLKARIAAESERLRTMKVGEDFFGGSLSSILDKFDRGDWTGSGASHAVGALGLEVGTSNLSSAARRADGTAHESIFALNAQERIQEVRRVRAEEAASQQHARDHSDARTIDSLATPSIAALLMLDGSADSALEREVAEPKFDTMYPSQSYASARNGFGLPTADSTAAVSNASHFSDGLPKSHSIWSIPHRRDSLLSRPNETLASAASPTSVLDRPRPRKPKPVEMGGVEIAKGHLEAQSRPQEKPAEDNRSTLDSIWRGPKSERTEEKTSVQSKDKPAPVKSAIKGASKPKSLADTLLNFSPFSSPDKKNKKKKEQKDKRITDATRAQIDENDASRDSKVKSEDETNAEATSMASSATRSTIAESEPETFAPSKGEQPIEGRIQSTVRKPSQERSEKAESLKVQHDDDTVAIPVQSSAQGGAMSSYDTNDVSLPALSSEAWSGASTSSTGGPATPSPSDVLGKQHPVLSLPQGDEEEMSYTQSKSADAVPTEVVDSDRTPMAERQEPAFGVNLIPPTPPATTDTPPVNQADASPLKAGLQRSSSSRSKTALRRDDSGLTRNASVKSKEPVQYIEYKGRGLSLPPGLIATTVASSSSRRRLPDAVPESEPTIAEMARSSSVKAERKSSKGKKGKRPLRNESSPVSGQRGPPLPSQRDSDKGETSTIEQSLSHKLATLAPQSQSSSQSDHSSWSQGSESNFDSRPVSPVPTPPGGRSWQSSTVSTSVKSDTSSRGRGPTSSMVVPPPIPRKIRTVTPGANGHARTSMMSSINEWESSPIDHAVPSGMQSPTPSAGPYPAFKEPTPPSTHQTPRPSIDRSEASMASGVSPAIVRNAPMGAPTAEILDGATQRNTTTPRSGSIYAASASGRESPAPWRDSQVGGSGSIMSHGGMSDYSVATLPNVPVSQSSYRAKDPIKASNAIDERLYAKTTMLTISVTSGAFKNKSLRRGKSLASLSDEQSSRAHERAEGALIEELNRTVISMTSHTPPPRKLSSTQVLVQIVACALDEMDRLILRERVRSETAYGFVPGRSFCGRVMETGWEVKRLRKGDVIFGLQSSKRCGALAEFMTIEQDLVAKAPEDCLTTEQIAALPSVGILSHQLMINHCSQVPRGARILILNAHDGVGLLTMQNCASLGLIIVAHCPQQIADGVAVCEANGAHEVIVGEPLWALNTLHESSFDLVIDTIGGRRIYDASRRILAYEGQFCTCFGDLHSAAANPNLRSHLRSLRRSFFRKDTKRIGYEWVGTETAEDNREALEAVSRAAQDGAICPRLKSVLGFSDAPRAFEPTLRGAGYEGDEAGATVVRVA